MAFLQHRSVMIRKSNLEMTPRRGCAREPSSKLIAAGNVPTMGAMREAVRLGGMMMCLAGLVACGGRPTAQLGGDAGSIIDAASDALPEVDFPAPHPSAPQIEHLGGTVLTTPQITSVYFANEDPTFTATLDAFTAKLVKSAWAGVAVEYGVGVMSAMPSIKLSETSPMVTDLATIGAWLAGKLNGNDPLWPTAGPSTLFVLYYPSGVTITASGMQSCTAFGALHSSVTLDSAHSDRDVAFIVVPRCETFKGFRGIDAATVAVSGKIVAAVTDPYPEATPAFWQNDQDHIVWDRVMGGGEVDSECGLESSSFQTFADLPFFVQRFWSNRSAAAGHAFCVPVPDGECTSILQQYCQTPCNFRASPRRV